jgi:hypothetical protein
VWKPIPRASIERWKRGDGVREGPSAGREFKIFKKVRT